MNEQQWDEYMTLLAQSSDESTAHCVSCWYEENGDTPFPADDSSSLCGPHAQATRDAYYGQAEGAQA
ncbi:MAG: hypothetical protein JO202_12610 [Ktedonobacteraceae bacterium]|nr:hypothetical protein [Ktedonobacteraceae bacterium]